MKFKEITTKSVPELQKELVALREQSQQLLVKNRLGQLKNFQQIRVMRKDIARVLTALKQKA